MKITSIIGAFCMVLLPFLLSGQKIIKAKKLKKDFDKLITKIEAHPDPYRNLPEEAYHKRADSLRATIKDMDAVSFYKLCAPLIHEIGDGHTSLHMPSILMKRQMKELGAFPYEIYISDASKMFVIKNYSEEETIPLGSEILSINGLSIPEFLEAIDPYTYYETKPFRNFTVEDRIQECLHLQFGDFTALDIIYHSDAEHQATVKNILYKTYEDAKDDQKERVESLIKRGEPYEYEKIKDGIGILKIHSFAISDQFKFEGFLRRTFKKINKDEIHSLILDVRGNLGGFPRASKFLYHYITDVPFKLMAISSMKISDPYRRYYKTAFPHVNFNALTFNRTGYDIDLYTLFNGELGTLSTEVNENNEIAETQDHEFKGDLYLLTDRKSFSAASSFAATFRCYGLGVIVGEPTGGTKTFFGNSAYFSLTHSNLSLSVGTAKNYTTCFTEDENEAIIPDIEVRQSVVDRVNNSDQTLFYTLRLIKKMRANEK